MLFFLEGFLEHVQKTFLYLYFYFFYLPFYFFRICSSFAENHAAVFCQVGNFASVIVLHHRTVDYKLSFCQVVGNKDKNEEKIEDQPKVDENLNSKYKLEKKY